MKKIATEPKPAIIKYDFKFENGYNRQLTFKLHPLTLTLMQEINTTPPPWTKLSFHQCSCCSLNEKITPCCPVALNLMVLVENFKDNVSTDLCQVQCQTAERKISKQLPIQDALAPVFFLSMIASDCPVTSLLKPLALYHVPFMPTEEMILRVSSLFLLGQYFRCREKDMPDISFKDFNKSYEYFLEVYQKILSRIQKLTPKDAYSNAMVILNSMAQILSLEIKDNLDDIKYMFSSWL
jgi:hypothetical protein